MKEKLSADLKKYEAEIAAVNKRLAEIDEQRQSIITHGRRIEGIVAYIKATLEEGDKPGQHQTDPIKKVEEDAAK